MRERLRFYKQGARAKITIRWMYRILLTSTTIIFISCAEARVLATPKPYGELPSILSLSLKSEVSRRQPYRGLLLFICLRLKGGEKNQAKEQRNVSLTRSKSASNHEHTGALMQQTENRHYHPLQEIWTLTFIMAFINVFTSSTLMLESDTATNALNYQVVLPNFSLLSPHTFCEALKLRKLSASVLNISHSLVG
jgi:hypothetical protein